jgi:hypothetical protein
VKIKFAEAVGKYTASVDKENSMNCNKDCKICNRIVISTAVTVVTVDGTDTLVIDLPAGPYLDRCNYCIVIAQTIPTTATIAMPVAFSIAGDVTTVYPFINCNCTQVTACGVQTRTRYPVTVHTNTVSGVFRSSRALCCYPSTNLASLPAPAAE